VLGIKCRNEALTRRCVFDLVTRRSDLSSVTAEYFEDGCLIACPGRVAGSARFTDIS